MNKTIQTPTMARFYRLLALCVAWALASVAAVCALGLTFLALTPVGDATPIVSALILTYGPAVPLLIGLTLFVSITMSLLFFSTAPLLILNLKSAEHEYMMVEVERLIPLAMTHYFEVILGRCADAVAFSRLVSFLQKEAPKLRREYLELVAIITKLSYDEIRVLDVESKALQALTSEHEAILLSSIESVDRARGLLKELTPIIRKLRDQGGDTTVQARRILAEIEDMAETLRPVAQGNNVHMLRPAE